MTNDEISLREFMEARWAAHEREHVALQRAVDTAVGTLDARLSEMNQFRAQIQEERGEFLSKTEYESRHRELETKLEAGQHANGKRISDLELAKSNMDGRMWAIGAGVTVLTIVVNMAFRFWPK
jgi:hypothetical protein